LTPPPATLEPTLAANLTATAAAFNRLTAPRSNGIFRIGVEILPGRWESSPGQLFCRWQRRDEQGGILNDFTGASGGTITIRPTDYDVAFNGCGAFHYLDPNAPVVLQSDATAPKGEGVYRVGVEIAPGVWRTQSDADGNCYFARLDVDQNIIDNDFLAGEATVTIAPTDYEVMFDFCTAVEYVGPQ
jgi:hypothetical protein